MAMSRQLVFLLENHFTISEKYLLIFSNLERKKLSHEKETLLNEKGVKIKSSYTQQELELMRCIAQKSYVEAIINYDLVDHTTASDLDIFGARNVLWFAAIEHSLLN